MDAIPAGALILGVKLFLVVNVLLIIAAYLVYFERKISAWMQSRVGPNRVGPLGLLQSFADVFKLYTKEDIVPALVDKKIPYDCTRNFNWYFYGYLCSYSIW